MRVSVAGDTSGARKLENMDVSCLVSSHFAYREKLTELIQMLGLSSGVALPPTPADDGAISALKSVSLSSAAASAAATLRKSSSLSSLMRGGVSRSAGGGGGAKGERGEDDSEEGEAGGEV